MHTHINPDDVHLLWTQSPRFVEIMRSSSGLQHPHYFFSQMDKLNSLLGRLDEDRKAFGPSNHYFHAEQTLQKLLRESQSFSGLTRANLRHLEREVRTFVDEVQNVDELVTYWDEIRKQRSATMISIKRGWSDDEEDGMVYSFKRRRKLCGSERLESEAGADVAFGTVSSWILNESTPRGLWSEPLYSWT